MSVANDLLSNYQHVIETLTFTMGTKGIFDVSVDGEKIFSKHATGRHANEGEVLQLFVEFLDEDVPAYGS